MNSGHISSGLDLTYVPSTITSQKPTEHAIRTTLVAPATLNPHTPNASITTAETAPTPTNSSTEAPTILNTSHDVDEIQQHFYQKNDQPQLQSKVVANNARNAIFDENMFINPFAPPSTSSDESSSQYVDPGLYYTKASGFELTGFSDADHAGCQDTLKSTFGGTQFLGEKQVSCSSKKQDFIALSTVETEYVSLSA
ncbi:hypothetical protein Tco_1000398 [Tanacetum coccineum]